MDEDALTPEQTAAMREVLVELAGSLEASLEEGADGAKPVDLDEPIGRVSRMDAMQQQEMASANRRSQALRLELVRAALARVDRGEYGFCLECEEPIGLARLKAKPESRLCVSCQSAREHG